MSWSESLIKLSTYEVETRQKRLSEVATRREAAEQRLARLVAEGEAERTQARDDAATGLYHARFLEGLKLRMATVQVDIDALLAEERGARDALAEAFEEQKKYEHIAETMRRAEVKEVARRETAALDELGLRRASR